MHKSMIKAILTPIASFFILGIILIFAGIGFGLAIWSTGYRSNIEGGLILGGIISIIISIYFIIKIPFNSSVKCWKHYGDAAIDEINDIIESNPKSEIDWGDSLIVTDSWIIDKSDFLFFRFEDVSWFYINLTEKGSWYLEDIFFYSNFSVKFDKRVKSVMAYYKPGESNPYESIENDALVKLNYLHLICPKAIVGSKPKYENIWKNSPENFIKNANTE